MDELIAVLEQKLDLTAEEISDILWLALLQWQTIPRESDAPPPLPPSSPRVSPLTGVGFLF